MSAYRCSRRKFVGGVAAVAGGAFMSPGLIAMPTQSVDSIVRNLPPLYKTLSPIAGEYRKVRLFFSQNCNHSRSFHDLLFKWGMTLPKEIKFLPTPALVPGDDSAAALGVAFYAAWLASPEKLNSFMKNVYGNVQSLRMDPTRFETYFDAARNAGVDRVRFRDAINNGAMSQSGLDASLVAAKYQLTATPAIGIGGQFLVTPDGVAGNEELLIQLLNALTSKVLIGE